MHPTLFGIIDTYTVLAVIGFLVSPLIFWIYFDRKLDEGFKNYFYVLMTGLIAAVIGFVGAVLTQNLYSFIQDPSSYQWTFAMTFYGGLFFGVVAFLVVYFAWARKHYRGLHHLLQIFPACICFAQAFGRVGCFFAGCCYGLPTEEWYGMYFPTLGYKAIPTNLYEAIFLFLLATVLLVLALNNKKDVPMPLYLLAYGVFRFLIEFLRDDHRGAFIPGISPSQFWSIIMVVSGFAYIVFSRLYWKKAKQEPVSE